MKSLAFDDQSSQALATSKKRKYLDINGESHEKGSIHGQLSSTSVENALEMAFVVPPNIFEHLWDSYKQCSFQKIHSIIMTVPIEDRVASVMLSIPRANAVAFGYNFELETITNGKAIFS